MFRGKSPEMANLFLQWCDYKVKERWKKDSHQTQHGHFQQAKSGKGWSKIPCRKHHGSWRKCKTWWQGNRSPCLEKFAWHGKGASGLAKKGLRQRENDGDRRIPRSWRRSVKKTRVMIWQEKTAWIGLQSWKAGRSGVWEAQTTLHFLAESTWVAEHRNCTATAQAKRLRAWVLALDAHPPGHVCPQEHTHRQTPGWAISTPDPLESEIWLFFFFSQMTFVDSFLKWLLNLNVFFNISSFISATSTPGGDFFPQLW